MDRPWRWPGAPPTSFAGRLETMSANDIIEPRHTVGADGPYRLALAEGRLDLPPWEGCNRWDWPAVLPCGECGRWAHGGHPELGSESGGGRGWEEVENWGGAG